MDFATSFAASSFRKVLKGFEIGGLPYADVQFHLQRLLDAGFRFAYPRIDAAVRHSLARPRR